MKRTHYKIIYAVIVFIFIGGIFLPAILEGKTFNRSEYYEVPLKIDSSRRPRPHIRCKLNHKEVCLLVDTGATNSIIYKTAVEKSGLKEVAGGERVHVKTLSFGKFKVIKPFFICEDSGLFYKPSVEDGILGSSFLLKHKAIIDYGDSFIYFRKDTFGNK